MILTGVIRKAILFPKTEDNDYAGIKIKLSNGEVINTNAKFFHTSTGISLPYQVDKPTPSMKLVGVGIEVDVTSHKAGEAIPGKNGKVFKNNGYSVDDISLITKREADIYSNQVMLNRGMSKTAIQLSGGAYKEISTDDMDLEFEAEHVDEQTSEISNAENSKAKTETKAESKETAKK